MKSTRSSNDEKDAATLSFSRLHWVKREMAIKRLYVAFCNGSLIAVVRDPVSGALFQLISTDWKERGAPLRSLQAALKVALRTQRLPETRAKILLTRSAPPTERCCVWPIPAKLPRSEAVSRARSTRGNVKGPRLAQLA